MIDVDMEKRGEGLASATRDQLQLLGRVNSVVSAHYDEEVASTFLRTSCPYISDRKPLDVIAQEEPAEAQRLVAQAVIGFLQP